MIFMEDERIKLNGVFLPGPLRSIEVTETARVDEQEVEGSAAKPKQATGYEDAKINIELIIDDTETSTKYERYAALREIFRKSGQTVPQPISIVSEDTAAHGIEKVIFKRLTHKGENKKSQLIANLELWEYIPQTIVAVKNSGGTQSVSGGQSTFPSGGHSSAGSTGLGGDYQEYLNSDRGTAPASSLKKRKRMEIKRKKSPAVDNAKAENALKNIAKLPY